MGQRLGTRPPGRRLLFPEPLATGHGRVTSRGSGLLLDMGLKAWPRPPALAPSFDWNAEGAEAGNTIYGPVEKDGKNSGPRKWLLPSHLTTCTLVFAEVRGTKKHLFPGSHGVSGASPVSALTGTNNDYREPRPQGPSPRVLFCKVELL